LEEILDVAPEHLLDLGNHPGVDVHGDNGTLVVVDAEACGALKTLEEGVQASSRRHVGTQDDERVFHVLKKRTWCAVNQGGSAAAERQRW
jgi:hypothetical protein